MKGKKVVEGMTAGAWTGSAANDEFVGTVEPPTLEPAQAGWDPYEVWRTRVKASARKSEPEHDSRR